MRLFVLGGTGEVLPILNAILRNWWEEGLHTIDEIYEQELLGDF
ncbi:hypothetical protein [Jeotgalibaca caeni]|nr:hypothetical protein [Jeotgalibaca caeni]MDE1549843.1 hypothetical protein [Jeotgalibaca caeni]